MATFNQKVEGLKRRKVRPMGPGQLAAGLVEELEMSQTQAAQRLGITRVHLNRFFNDKVSLTPDMANRLGRFFGNGAAFWLRVQHTRDLWDLLNCDTRLYEAIEPLPKAA